MPGRAQARSQDPNLTLFWLCLSLHRFREGSRAGSLDGQSGPGEQQESVCGAYHLYTLNTLKKKQDCLVFPSISLEESAINYLTKSLWILLIFFFNTITSTAVNILMHAFFGCISDYFFWINSQGWNYRVRRIYIFKAFDIYCQIALHKAIIPV